MQPTNHPGVYRLPDRRFRTIARYTDPRTGLSRRRVKTWSTKQATTPAHAAALRLADLETVKAGLLPQQMRMRDYSVSWIERKVAELAPSTSERYVRSIRQQILPGLGDLYLHAMQPVDIVRWRDGLAKKYAPPTTNGHLRILREILADAAAELQLPNPAARVRQVAEDPRAAEGKALAPEDLGRVLVAMRELDLGVYSVLLTLALTGMRWSEASALHWKDISQAQIRIRRSQVRGHVRDITKSKRSRTVPLVPELFQILEQHRAREMKRRAQACELVWCTEDGKPRSRTWAAKALDRAIKIAETKRITPHGFRHTWNDILRRVTTTDVTKAITGHVTETMREHYSHVDAGEKTTAALRALRLVRAGT